LAVPGFLRLQFRAIVEAVYASLERGGRPDVPISLPFVTGPEEIQKARLNLKVIVVASQKVHENPISIHLGTQIGVPRAALTSERLVVQTDFLSVNVNNLTGTAFGYDESQADAQFLNSYRDWDIFQSSPFETLDVDGVGQLIRMSVDAARKSNPRFTIGAFGRQTGNSNSIQFFIDLGLDYVSCAPGKIPIVRLAAAQAVIKEKEEVEEQPEFQEEAPPPPEETDDIQEDD
jgi:pyruvate,orthophosphate dikinase